MNWGSTPPPWRARHDTEEAVYLPTQHNAEGALMFLLGNDYDEDASDESLIGKAAVKTLKYPSASNSVYRAMITIGNDRRSALLRKWVADNSTKPMTKKSAKNLSLFDSPRYNPGKGEKHVQDSACSAVGWEKKKSTKPLSQKTEGQYTMRMPDWRGHTIENTPTPQSRRIKSCDSDSFVFLETPLASPNAGGKYGETVSSSSSYGGWDKPRSAIDATPAASSSHWNNNESVYMPSSAAATPVSQQYHSSQKNNWGQCSVDDQSKSQDAGFGLFDSDGLDQVWLGPPSVTQHFVRGRGWTTVKNGVGFIDEKNNLGWDQCPSPAKSESKQTAEQSKLQNQIESLQWRLADMSDSLQQVIESQEELKASVDQSKPATTAHNGSQPCSATPSKLLYDLLAMLTAIAPPPTTPQLDNATRESIHRVEVEVAKLSVNIHGQAAPIINNNEGEVALREVKRLDGILTRAVNTIDRQASLIENLEKRQTAFATMYDDKLVQCEVRIAECEDQMERYPGDWDFGEMNERINSVNDRLDKLENPNALDSYGCPRIWCECDDCNTAGQAAEGRKIEDHQNGAGPDWQHNTCSRCPTDTHYTRHCHLPPMELCGWGCGWAEHLGQGCRLGQAPYGVPPPTDDGDDSQNDQQADGWNCQCEECVSSPKEDAWGSSKTQEDVAGWGPPDPCSACGSTSHTADDCWGDGLCSSCGEEEHEGWKCRERIRSPSPVYGQCELGCGEEEHQGWKCRERILAGW